MLIKNLKIMILIMIILKPTYTPIKKDLCDILWSAAIFKPHQSQFANDTTTSTKQQSVIHSTMSQTSDTQNTEKARKKATVRSVSIGSDKHTTLTYFYTARESQTLISFPQNSSFCRPCPSLTFSRGVNRAPAVGGSHLLFSSIAHRRLLERYCCNLRHQFFYVVHLGWAIEKINWKIQILNGIEIEIANMPKKKPGSKFMKDYMTLVYFFGVLIFISTFPNPVCIVF